MGMTLEELARCIGATLRPNAPDDGQRIVHRCASLESAREGDVTFLANPRYAQQANDTQASAVILAEGATCNGQTLLEAEDPYFAFRNAMVALHGFRQHPCPEEGEGISPMATVDPTAVIGEGTRVHPYTVIGQGATIGRDCILYPHVYVGPFAQIGDACVLYPNVVLDHRCVLGHRVVLHAGCVIGQDGFGYATHGGCHHKIPQTGNVVIQDDVEMGAACTVDRATMGSTVIGEGTKMGNLIVIGHGARIGRHNLLVSQVGIAGSTTTGDHVVMGGQVGVAGHLKIGHRVQLAATSGVHSDIPDGSMYGGTPAVELNLAKRTNFYFQRLPELAKRIKALEKELERLKGSS